MTVGITFQAMNPMCARLSCDEHAAASLIFDADGSRVLIIDLADVTEGIPVCRGHARTRTAPMGWTLHDERTVAQRSLWANSATSLGTGTDSAVTDQPHRYVPMIDREVATIPPTRKGPSSRPSVRRPVTAAGQADSGDSRFVWGSSDDQAAPTPQADATSPLLSRAFRSIN